ncbi:carboxylesterase/lipase family protein [Pseudomonas sp. BGr12]|uniref:carboxylesterase/lipase family protein n=1 Tax=Pseudomonas sp. BGr12 TaxID=2936269 RepID=UPI002559C887|nr:carboxylesterase family protein [Pseudomonas sp. BJa5]MDL2426300.1 carboxylesterase family protein [Pseudomonas sp. BJa5]
MKFVSRVFPALIIGFCSMQLSWADQDASADKVKPIVKVNEGKLQGTYSEKDGLYKFLGIPYAKAPVGKLRFKAPVPAEHWAGVKDTTKFGPVSAQAFDEHEGTMEEFGGDLTNEDSLSLNIWTPNLKEKLPVMVWLHGGGNAHSSARVPGYHGDMIARRGNVVFVSLNYRLGIFGFIDMSLIGGPEYAGSVNNGVRDQMLALKWVRDNIARFGGDPDNITAFGESSGASDLSAMLGTGQAKTLFDKVILQSGSAFLTRSPKSSARMNRGFFERMGVTSIDQIKDLPASVLIEKQEEALKGMLETDVDLLFQPTMDSVVVKDFPLDAIRRGDTKDINMLVGTTKNELMLYTEYDPQLLDRQPEDLPELQVLPWVAREAVSSIYKWNRPDMKPGQVSMDIYSDFAFRIPAIRMAEAQSANAQNAWMYRFDWPIPGSELGAPHGSELAFLFGRMDDVQAKVKGATSVAPSWTQLSENIQDIWTAFARTGRPIANLKDPHERDVLATLEPYSESSRSTLLLNTPLEVESDPAWLERFIYSSMPFNGYFDEDELAESE